MRRTRFFGLAIAIGMLWPSFSCSTRLANAGVVVCYGECDVDDDGDGYSDLAGDCDDATSAKYPGASETCLAAGGLTDDNCNGCTDEGCQRPDLTIIDCEQDGDGVSALQGDCNDQNANIYPGANEVCGDGVDNDCDHIIDTDAVEICDNGVDDDCDEQVDGDDPECSGGGQDNDDDGYSPNDGDCNDDDSTINPDAVEVCDDSVDNNCDGNIDTQELICQDGDEDGVTVGAGDCNDNDASIYPDASEDSTNGVDDNCNALVDEILGGQVLATGGAVEVKVLSGFTGLFNDDICLVSPGPVNCFAVNNLDGGKVVQLGTFPAGTELLFGIVVHNTVNHAVDHFSMGPACRNFDAAVHNFVQTLPSGAVRVGFEDLRGGANSNFVDAGFDLTGGTVIDPTTSVPERCNGVDDDCSSGTDNNPVDVGLSCSTGQQGVCAAGTTQCTDGSLSCVQDQTQSAEVCDGLDNNCDGLIDNAAAGVGQACSTGQPGVCSVGTQVCSSGSLSCQQTTSSSTEVCDGEDNDCDGQTDEDDVCGPPGIHDLAVTSIAAPATVTMKGGVVQTKTVTVQIQNRGSHIETIPDAVALGSLVHLSVESLVLNCPITPTVVLDPPKKFPVTLKSKGKTGVKFAVTFSGACDPEQATKKDPGHDDYTYRATVHHSVLGGTDVHPADDSCPRTALGIVPNPDGKIKDLGCAEERTDVVLK